MYKICLELGTLEKFATCRRGLNNGQNIERLHQCFVKLIIVVRDISIFVRNILILKAIHQCSAANIAGTAPQRNDPQIGNDRYPQNGPQDYPKPQMISRREMISKTDRK